MKNINKILLLVFSLLMVFSISLNTNSYIYADDEDVTETINEDSSETEEVKHVSSKITFVDEQGNPFDIEDTITIYQLQNPEKPYVFDAEGNGEISVEIVNGTVEFTNLKEGDTYYISFDGNSEIDNHFYIFKDELEDGMFEYHQ